MVIFDKSNVHFMWDDSLVGRPCYYADNVDELVKAITGQRTEDIGIISKFGDNYEPFYIRGRGYYSLVYPTDVNNQSSYDASYIKFEWDPSLEGKRGLLANSIEEILSKLNMNVAPELIYKTPFKDKEHPFKSGDSRLYKFAYFDPYYIFRHAFIDGEPIEYLDGDNVWRTLKNCVFNLPISHYRFKYEASLESDPVPTDEPDIMKFPLTNMQVARWLADGNGYAVDKVDGKIFTSISFEINEKNHPFDKNRYALRTW